MRFAIEDLSPTVFRALDVVGKFQIATPDQRARSCSPYAELPASIDGKLPKPFGKFHIRLLS